MGRNNPECPVQSFARLDDKSLQDHIGNCCWIRSEVPYKAVAVVSRNGYSVHPWPREPHVPGVFLPVSIQGPIDFHLLACWTQITGAYIEYCREVFESYQEFLLGKPSVIAGDLNSNAIFDYQHPKSNHTMTVDYLHKKFGLVSSYHKKLQAIQGKEEHPTFYMYRHQDKPFHLDYCFVPDRWEIKGIDVGSWEEWHLKSDHCPLVVDIEI